MSELIQKQIDRINYNIVFLETECDVSNASAQLEKTRLAGERDKWQALFDQFSASQQRIAFLEQKLQKEALAALAESEALLNQIAELKAQNEWKSLSEFPPELSEHNCGKKMLVTNNISARNNKGEMSHVWLSNPQWSKDREEWVAFDDADRMILGLTHYYNPFK